MAKKITEDVIQEIQELTNKAQALQWERLWRLKFEKELQDLNLTEEDIDGYDIRDTVLGSGLRHVPGRKRNRRVMVGCWLKKPRYKDKQKGHSSNYRRFSVAIPVCE